MAEVEWKTLINSNIKVNRLHQIPVNDHPLKNIITERIPRRILGTAASTGITTPVTTPVSLLEPLTQALKQLDPLSEFAIQEMDPLSKMAAEIGKQKKIEIKSIIKKETEDIFHEMEPWSARRTAILNKYTTSEKLSIITSFLSEGEKGSKTLFQFTPSSKQYREKFLTSLKD